jgi:hypothetical protein
MEIGRKAWQSVELPICPSRFDRNGLALNVTGFFESLPKRGQKLHVRISRSRADQANDRHRRLLRARRERPCHRAAKNRATPAGSHHTLHFFPYPPPGERRLRSAYH